MLSSACAMPRWYDYGFSPAPLEAEVATADDPAAELRVLVSILGIARGQDGKADQVEVRMRLENLGTTPVKLLTDSFSLCSADLQLFGTPTVLPADVPILEASRSTVVDLAFPLPPEKHPTDMNLRGLNLRWTVSFGEHHVTTGASFTRSDWRAPYDDYPRVNAGMGIISTPQN
jgi:hypothetical protein